MKKVYESNINGIDFKYYFGIDIKIIDGHSPDGSDGFMFIFIDSIKEEETMYNRNFRIDYILGNEEKIDNLIDHIDNVNNSYISIYQTGGSLDIKKMFEIIRDKIELGNAQKPWSVVSGLVNTEVAVIGARMAGLANLNSLK